VNVQEMIERDLQGKDLWRRQCARNVMDCYAAAMEVLADGWDAKEETRKPFETLARLMVDGMTAVKTLEDERAFYRMAAAVCRECMALGGRRAGIFRVYGAIFGDMADQEG
jgi:hypothetical protein